MTPNDPATQVWRGYIAAATGQWVEPALVMRNIFYQNGTRFGNWVDTDILEEEMHTFLFGAFTAQAK